jgi:hypothetical protein
MTLRRSLGTKPRDAQMFTFGVTRIDRAYFSNPDDLKEIMSKVSELTAAIEALKKANAEHLALARKLTTEQASLLDRITRLEDEKAAHEEIPDSLLTAAAEAQAGQVEVGRALQVMDTLVADLTPAP